MFNKIWNYYKKGYYTNRHILVYTQKGILTAAEYETITGEVYPG